MSRVLGLDYGELRIGVAISDPDRTMALPLAVLPAHPRERLAAELTRICRERNVAVVVVGLPVHLDGREGASAAAARELGEWVRQWTGCPVELWDERMTSAEAERVMKEGGVRAERRRRVVDQLAAQLLLQSYLDHRRMTESGDWPEVEP